MLERARQHLTYANVVSSLCLFIVLGGGAYAAATIGSGQIKNNSIQGKDIRNSSITGGDVKNRSLTGSDFKAGQLPSGPAGARGGTGPQGSPAASLLTGRGTYDSTTGTYYFAPSGLSPSTSAGSANATPSPAAPIVARDLYVRSLQTNASFNLNVNGQDTALGCAIPFGAPTTVCSNSSAAVTIAPGSRIVLKAVFGGSGGENGSYPVEFAWRATTP